MRSEGWMVSLESNRRTGHDGGYPSSWTAGIGSSAVWLASSTRCGTCCPRHQTTVSRGQTGQARTRLSERASWGWMSRRRSHSHRHRSPGHASAEWQTWGWGPTAFPRAEDHIKRHQQAHISEMTTSKIMALNYVVVQMHTTEFWIFHGHKRSFQRKPWTELTKTSEKTWWCWALLSICRRCTWWNPGRVHHLLVSLIQISFF